MLKEKLQQDIKNALKTGNSIKRLVLGMVLNSIKNRELQKRAKSGKAEELNDDEVLEVVASEVKKRKESIESYEKGGRTELAQKEREELNILMTYMPEQMSEETIREEAKKAITETNAKDIREIGKVLSVLMPKLKGRADGQTVSRIVKETLTS
ncbi:MAG: GatB/YqeY domain-containing protein [Patescibacteria group bacterium]